MNMYTIYILYVYVITLHRRNSADVSGQIYMNESCLAYE